MSITERARRYRVGLIAIAIAAVLAVVLWQPLSDWFFPSDETGQATSGPPDHDHATEPAEPEGEEVVIPSIPPGALSDPVRSLLIDALTSYDQIGHLLVNDKLDGVSAHAGDLADRLHRAANATTESDAVELRASIDRGQQAATQLAQATSLEDARRHLSGVSRELVALVAADEQLQASWHRFECPMTKGFNQWIQSSDKISNPYMGQDMPACGSQEQWQQVDAPEVTVSHEGHGHEGDDIAFWTCSMHPSVRQAEAGPCPICSMDLLPVTFEEYESGVVLIDAERRNKLGIVTEKLTKAPMNLVVRAVGRVAYDETRLEAVSLKLSGWISKLHVSETGQAVKKGQVLMTLYSPELYAAQEEYLLARRSVARAKDTGRPSTSESLLAAAERKLRLWDMTPRQIAQLAERGTPLESVPILAPASGFVIEKNVIEGANVKAGETLFRIAALDRVWVLADVYEADLARMRPGLPARIELTYQPGEPLVGKVSYVYPYLDPQSRTGQVRIELKNRDLSLRPDMYATVAIEVDLGERLQVPMQAVLYTGPRRLVFVDLGGGRLRPQEVVLGARSGDMAEVISGLAPGQQVVTSGNFLVAAESRLRSAANYFEGSETADEPKGSAEQPPGGAHAGH